MATTNKVLLPVMMLLLFGAGAFLYVARSLESTFPVEPLPEPDRVEHVIIAFGDSLTAGYGLPAHESYPAQLETLLTDEGAFVRVINAGVSGETTRGNRERASFIRSQEPDIVLLGIGGNDALRTLPLEETRMNIAASIETLRAGDEPPTIILLAMQAPLNSGLAYKRAFDGLYADLAAEYDLVLVPFITSDVFLDPANKLPDGIHLNKSGYGIVAREYILPAVREALNERER